MNNIIHHARRRASHATTNSSTLSHKHDVMITMMHRNHQQKQRLISTTPHLSKAMPAAKTSPDEARVAQKKVKKEKRGPSASKLAKEQSQESKIYELMIKAYDAPGGIVPKASEEEMERRYQVGRNYVIGCFKRHNELNHDLAVKIRMKKYAIKNLPREGMDLGDELDSNGKSVYGKWKSNALKINKNWGPPDHRHIPMFTPPIEGFDPTPYMEREEDD